MTLPTSVTVARGRASASATTLGEVVRWHGHHDELRLDVAAGRLAAPIAVAIRRFSGVHVAERHVDAAATQRQPDRGTQQPGADHQDGTRQGVIGHLADPGQVAPQGGGAVQVDVGDVGAWQLGLDVRQHPHHPWHRAVDLELAGADQRHSPKPSRRAAYAGNSETQVGRWR